MTGRDRVIIFTIVTTVGAFLMTADHAAAQADDRARPMLRTDSTS